MNESRIAHMVAWLGVVLATDAGLSGNISFLIWSLLALSVIVQFTRQILDFVIERWIVDDMPEFDDAEEARVWFETHGYEVVHECEPMPGVTHLAAEKYSRVPLMGYERNVHIFDDEEAGGPAAMMGEMP